MVLADGLGSENLANAAGHARNLNRLPKLDLRIATVFPTTTAAALVSLTSGVMPGEHGFVGYNVYDRDRKRSQNMLSGWSNPLDSLDWLNLEAAGPQAGSLVRTFFLGHSSYQSTGFTNVLLPDAEFLPGDTLSARFSAAIELAKSGARGVAYLYVPELDQIGHSFGPNSDIWLERLEEFDRLMGELVGSLRAGQQAVLTADHGMVQVEYSEQVHWDQFELAEPLFVGGDTRCNFVYLKDTKDLISYRDSLSELLPQSVLVATPAELHAAGWVKLGDRASARIPDLYLICSDKGALYHRAFAAPKSLKMLGHHGGISSTELNVPGILARG